MGYLAKHIKVRRQKWRVRVIATAALSGAVISKRMVWMSPTGRILAENEGTWHRDRRVPQYQLIYNNGEHSRWYESRGEAASVYLLWWFDKHGIYPWDRKYRVLP